MRIRLESMEIVSLTIASAASLSEAYSIRRIPRNTNTTVSNNYIANNSVYGIHIWDASNNIVVNNTVENNEYGIDFYGSTHNNTLRNNNMFSNKYNFGVILRGETLSWLSALSMVRLSLLVQRH